MKNLVIIFCFGLVVGCATVPVSTPAPALLHYEFVNDHSLSKNDAYESTLLWLAKNLEDYDDKSIKLKNKEAGVLLLDLDYYNEHKETDDDNMIDYFKNRSKRDPDNHKLITYQLEIVVKDHKVKYTFDIGCIKNSTRYPTEITIHKMSSKAFPVLVSKINNALKKEINAF